MFIDWGVKAQVWNMAGGAQVVLTYRYYQILWVFSLARHINYEWIFPTPDGPVTRPVMRPEIAQYKINDHLSLNWWSHYSLLVLIAAVAVYVITMVVIVVTGNPA